MIQKFESRLRLENGKKIIRTSTSLIPVRLAFMRQSLKIFWS